MMFLTKKSNGTVEKSYISKGEKDYASRVTQVKLIDQLISMNKDHIDDKWYAITQMMIWETVDKNNSFYFNKQAHSITYYCFL